MLTERQRQVAALIKAGKNYRAIARALGMSPHTVRSHVRSIAALLDNEHGLPALSLVRKWVRTRDFAVSSGGDAQQRQV